MPIHPTVQPVIAAMGGVVKASAALGCKPETFYQWRRIPSRWVEDVARLSGIPVRALPKPKSYEKRKG